MRTEYFVSIIGLAVISQPAAYAADILPHPGPVQAPVIEEPMVHQYLNSLDVRFETGVTAWYSNTTQDFKEENASTNVESEGDISLELTGKIRNVFNPAAHVELRLGLGAIEEGTFSGTYQNEDYSGGDLSYITADYGMELMEMGGFTIGGLLGYSFWRDAPGSLEYTHDSAANASAVTYDRINDSFFIPSATAETFTNIDALRLGVTAQMDLGDRISLSAELAALPYFAFDGNLITYDNPNSQLPGMSNLGTTMTALNSPIEAEGSGYGFQAQGMLSFALTENLVLSAGARYWRVEGEGTKSYEQATYTKPTYIQTPLLDSDGNQVNDTNGDPVMNFVEQTPLRMSSSRIKEEIEVELERIGLMAGLNFRF